LYGRRGPEVPRLLDEFLEPRELLGPELFGGFGGGSVGELRLLDSADGAVAAEGADTGDEARAVGPIEANRVVVLADLANVCAG